MDWWTAFYGVTQSRTRLKRLSSSSSRLLCPPLSPGACLGLPRWLNVKEPACQCRRSGFNSWVGKIPWRRRWTPTSAFLPGKSLGQRSLESCSPWGYKRVRHDLVTKQKQTSLLTITKIWKHLKCPLRSEWIKKMRYIQPSLGIHRALTPRPLGDTKIQGCSDPLHKMIVFAYNLCIFSVHCKYFYITYNI